MDGSHSAVLTLDMSLADQLAVRDHPETEVYDLTIDYLFLVYSLVYFQSTSAAACLTFEVGSK